MSGSARSGDAYRIVLAVVDGSPASEVAAETGAALADRSGAELHIAAAARPEEAKIDLGELVEVTEPGSREFHEHLQEHVHELTRSLGQRCGCPIEATVLTADDPAEGLTEYERRVGVDLTVIGVHRAESGPGVDAYRRLRGDVEERVPSPVLLIPSADTADERVGEDRVADGDGVAVLVGRAGGQPDAPIFEQAATFAGITGVPLWLVDASAAGALLHGDPSDEEGGPARQTDGSGIEEVAERLRSRGVDVRRAHLEGDRAREQFSDLLRDHAIGTVAVEPEGRRLAERLLLTPLGDADDAAAGERVAVLLCPASPGIV